MAKEIVIQQANATGDLWIYEDDQRRFMHIRQTPSDWVEVEPENIPRLISALCELSGVSGEETEELLIARIINFALDKKYEPTEEAYLLASADPAYRKNMYTQLAKLFINTKGGCAPLIPRLQAENDDLKSHIKDLQAEVQHWHMKGVK